MNLLQKFLKLLGDFFIGDAEPVDATAYCWECRQPMKSLHGLKIHTSRMHTQKKQKRSRMKYENSKADKKSDKTMKEGSAKDMAHDKKMQAMKKKK